MDILKSVFIFLNVLFFLSGGTMLGVGIWLAVDPNALDALNVANYAGMDDALWSAAVYTTIAIGALMFLVGFLGCFGAMRSGDGPSRALKIYHSILSLIISLEIVCIVLIAVFWGSIDQSVEDNMTKDVKNNYVSETATDGISSSWNKMQQDWKCCGSVNYMDYIGSNYTRVYGRPVPYTCCQGEEQNYALCQAEAREVPSLPKTFLYSKGCYQGLKDTLEANSLTLIIIASVFLGLEVLGFIMSCMFIKCAK